MLKQSLNYKQQKGFTLTGWIVVLAIFLYFVYMGMILTPYIVGNYTMDRILESLKEESGITQKSKREIRDKALMETFIGVNNFTEGLNPLVVGALIMAIGFSLGGTTGFAINPARDFGPRLAHFFLPIKGKGNSDWKYAPIPFFGPILGGLLGGAAYKILYENDLQIKYWLVLFIAAIILIVAAVKGIKSEKIE